MEGKNDDDEEEEGEEDEKEEEDGDDDDDHYFEICLHHYYSLFHLPEEYLSLLMNKILYLMKTLLAKYFKLQSKMHFHWFLS